MSTGFAGKTPQAALAVFAVIAAPVLVGQATAPKTTEEGPKPEAVKLNVRLDGDEMLSSGKALLLLEAKGPAPDKIAVLTGDGGRTVVQAKRAPSPGECKGLDARQATGGTDATQWCLELTGLNDGDAASGTLSATGAAVELTVSRRNPYLGWPLLLALGGLVVGAAVVLVPRSLRDRIRKATLDKTLDDNEKAAADRKIVCLKDWVTGRRTAGQSDDALLPIVAGTIRRATPIAARARGELAATANRLKHVLAGHPALTAADTEAKRTDHKRSEFLDDEGESVPHPAKALTALLASLAEAKESLELAEVAIGALPDGAPKAAAQEALHDARGAYNAADKPSEATAVEDSVAKLERAVASAQDQVSAAQQGPRIAIMGGRGRRFIAIPPVAARDDVTAAKAGPVTPPVAARRITGLIVLTIVVAAGVAAWALASLWLTVYEPKEAFGGIDYATLFVAAVGSGAAGAILTLVAAWDPLSPAEAD